MLISPLKEGDEFRVEGRGGLSKRWEEEEVILTEVSLVAT